MRTIKELGERKIYSIDIGLNNAIEFKFSDNIGKSLENAVFLELKRRYQDLFYYRDSNSECDFIVHEKSVVTQAIQVTYDMSNGDTKNRELKGLLSVCKKFELEKGIEQYLFKELGVEKIVVKPFKKGIINLFSYKNTIDRWDVHKGSVQAFSSLYNSKFPVQTLSDCFTFTNRSWNKKKHEEKTFNYIELGAVNPIYGVTEIKEIELDKAPSRATQFVKEGDLIIGTTRPYLKRFAIIKSQNDYDIASSGFQIIEPSNDYNLEFLLEYLKSDFGVKQFEFYMTGALYPAITGKDLRKILIPFPPIEIQNKIAKKTNEMKSKIKELKKRAQLNREQAIKEFENEIFVS